jgi:autotransporter adhesin
MAAGVSDLASGANSSAVGYSNYAVADDAVAVGNGNLAMGEASTAVGKTNIAMEKNAVAMGEGNTAEVENSAAVGIGNTASGYFSSAVGQENHADGIGSSAVGYNNTASGLSSSALGHYNTASGVNSSAVGNSNTAAAADSGAFGYNNTVTEDATNSYAIGSNSTVSAAKSVAIGDNATASTANSVALGSGAETVAAHTGTTAQQVTLAGTTYTYAGQASDDNGTVSVGKAGTERQIQNVAAGDITAASTDAVNGSQLYATNQAVDANTNNITTITNTIGTTTDGTYVSGSNTVGGNINALDNAITDMDNHINGIDRRVNKLGNRVDRVGAGAAALAALHPLDFDPDAKWDFAAGYGNYRGANAVAVGAYYRANEDTMFNVGGSFGGGENMVNAGVSLKIGGGNHVSTSKVAMAKQIVEQGKRIQTLTDQVAQLTAHLNAFMGTGVSGATTDFPDVPQNHWAYEYVTKLAGSGVLEGYEDGSFKGDRTMTRYEMAAIIYRAMQQGVAIDQKALTEFRPELDRIRVDTISKDKNGNPAIQRVRVIKNRG